MIVGHATADRRSGHRLLIRRLAPATVLISIALGLAVYAVERYRLRATVAEFATQRAGQFTAEAGALLRQPHAVERGQVQRRLEEFVEGFLPRPEGQVVAVILYDLTGAVAGSLARQDHPLRDDAAVFLEGLTPPPAPPELAETRAIELADTPVLLLHFPLRDRQDRAIGQAFGLFVASERYVAGLNRRIRNTVLTATLIVLLTSGLLYPVIIGLTRRLAALSMNLLDANLETLEVLGGAIAKRDADTDVHSYRVTIYSVRLAEAVGLDDREMQALIKGALLHDVGKIGTPDSILLKPGRLTEAEYEEMRKHVTHGLDVVQRSAWLADAAAVVGHHHEKVDGSGYHHGLRGGDIPLAARIFAIADVFDALTSSRPYKEPMDYDAAMSVLEEGRGTHFDPRLLDAFGDIALPLFESIADREDEYPREVLVGILERYFKRDLESVLS